MKSLTTNVSVNALREDLGTLKGDPLGEFDKKLLMF